MFIKKFTTGLLALTMVFDGAVMPMGTIAAETTITADAAVAPKTFNYKGYQLSYLNDGTLEITGFDAKANGFKGRLVIPATINDIKVSRIGKYAFQECTEIRELQISEGIKTIHDFGFYKCSGIRKIIFPKSLTIISYCAFDSCKSLTSIELPENIKSIGAFAFNGIEGVDSVFIPKSATSIGDGAFGFKYLGRYSVTKIYGFTVNGYKGSKAEEYAAANGLKFVSAGDANPSPTTPIKGDISGDGNVNINDVIKLAAVVKGKSKLPNGVNADFNGDNIIDIKDLIMLAAHVKGLKVFK